MHFSSPSGQRLSWCRPWNRGAVGSFSKGYCSVTTFLNMVRNVTPNPAIGSQNCSLSVGMSVLPAACGHGGGRAVEGQRLGGTRDGSACGHRRRREATRATGGGSLRGFLLFFLGPAGPERDRDEQHEQYADAGEEVSPVDAAVQRDGADRGHGDDPAERDRDQPLPAERHELVVAEPRQGPAQPDEDEDEEEHLAEE